MKLKSKRKASVHWYGPIDGRLRVACGRPAHRVTADNDPKRTICKGCLRAMAADRKRVKRTLARKGLPQFALDFPGRGRLELTGPFPDTEYVICVHNDEGAHAAVTLTHAKLKRLVRAARIMADAEP